METTDMEGNLVYVLGRQDPIISVSVYSKQHTVNVGSRCTPLVYAVNRGVVGPRGERGLPGIKETITSEQIDLLF